MCVHADVCAHELAPMISLQMICTPQYHLLRDCLLHRLPGGTGDMLRPLRPSAAGGRRRPAPYKYMSGQSRECLAGAMRKHTKHNCRARVAGVAGLKRGSREVGSRTMSGSAASSGGRGGADGRRGSRPETAAERTNARRDLRKRQQQRGSLKPAGGMTHHEWLRQDCPSKRSTSIHLSKSTGA